MSSLASLLIAVRWTAGSSQVQPISSRRSAGDEGEVARAADDPAGRPIDRHERDLRPRRPRGERVLDQIAHPVRASSRRSASTSRSADRDRPPISPAGARATSARAGRRRPRGSPERTSRSNGRSWRRVYGGAGCAARRRYTRAMTTTSSPFGSAIDAFLAEFFRLHPLHATAAGMHAHDAEWPALDEAGRRARLASRRPLGGRAPRVRRRGPDARRAGRSRPAPGRARRDPLRRDRAARRRPGTRSSGSTCSAAGSSRCSPASSRRWPSAWPRSPAGSRGSRRWSRRPGRSSSGCPAGPCPRSTPRPRSSSWPGSPSSSSDAVGEAEAAAPGDPAVAAVLPRLRAAAATGRDRAGRASRPTSATSSCRGPSGEGRLGADAVRARSCATRSSDPELTPARILERAEREYDAVRAEMIRLARDLWPAWMPRPRRGRPTTRRPSAASSTPSPAQHPAAGRAARLVPGRARPDRGVLPRARPRRAGRRAARDPLDAGLPARVRRRDARLAGRARPGQKAFFAITPIPDDWTPEQAESYLREDNDRMLRLLDDPRGRARPLPPGRRTPTATRRSSDRSSGAASSPRAGRST